MRIHSPDRIIADSVKAVKSDGTYAIIKGDPNAAVLLDGMLEMIGAVVEAGTIAGEGRKPDNAQANMEQNLTAKNNAVEGAAKGRAARGTRFFLRLSRSVQAILRSQSTHAGVRLCL